MKLKYVLSVPFTLLMGAIITGLFGLYKSNYIGITCTHQFPSVFSSYFLHTSGFHLLQNIILLMIVSKLEFDFGNVTFSLMFLSAVVVSALVEYCLRFHPKIPCSVGISGVLLGMLLIEISHSNKTFKVETKKTELS
jgi:membrane associated rhomboid family serine protease